jgi:hypothetical protein
LSDEVSIPGLRFPELIFEGESFLLDFKCSIRDIQSDAFSDFYVRVRFQTSANTDRVEVGHRVTHTYYRTPHVEEVRQLHNDENLSKVDISPVFPGGYLVADAGLDGRIRALDRASKGFPDGTPGSFLRMLYLSGVTITTVGYGDVLPTTSVTRTLVMSEAVLGLVVAGLFLNALANRITRTLRRQD